MCVCVCVWLTSEFEKCSTHTTPSPAPPHDMIIYGPHSVMNNIDPITFSFSNFKRISIRPKLHAHTIQLTSPK